MPTTPDISRHLLTRDGFCHPDWEAIGEAIDSDLPTEVAHEAWVDAGRAWVARLREQLGDGYETVETPNFHCLIKADSSLVKDTTRFYEDTLGELCRALDGIANDEGYGKHAVLMFADPTDYYRYISHLRKIEVDIHPPHEFLIEFIHKARADDAGAEACASTFEVRLEELVADFLGDGDWAPNPALWPAEFSADPAPAKYMPQLGHVFGGGLKHLPRGTHPAVEARIQLPKQRSQSAPPSPSTARVS